MQHLKSMIQCIGIILSLHFVISICMQLRKKLHGDGYKRNFITERLKRNKENYIEVNDLINVKENGEMLTHNSIKFLSRIIRDDLHMPFRFHNLRHTYATILAESGISPRYVQEMLGHSKLEFTLKYYTHITGHMADMARMAIDEKIKELKS